MSPWFHWHQRLFWFMDKERERLVLLLAVPSGSLVTGTGAVTLSLRRGRFLGTVSSYTSVPAYSTLAQPGALAVFRAASNPFFLFEFSGAVPWVWGPTRGSRVGRGCWGASGCCPGASGGRAEAAAGARDTLPRPFRCPCVWVLHKPCVSAQLSFKLPQNNPPGTLVAFACSAVAI